jgi:hypothetical protein
MRHPSPSAPSLAPRVTTAPCTPATQKGPTGGTRSGPTSRHYSKRRCQQGTVAGVPTTACWDAHVQHTVITFFRKRALTRVSLSGSGKFYMLQEVPR